MLGGTDNSTLSISPAENTCPDQEVQQLENGGNGGGHVCHGGGVQDLCGSSRFSRRHDAVILNEGLCPSRGVEFDGKGNEREQDGRRESQNLK